MTKLIQPQAHTLVFAETNRDTFHLIASGKKTIETRAGNTEYEKIQAGDSIVFSCGTDAFKKKVNKVAHFKNIAGMLLVYSWQNINPNVASASELVAKYHEFPGYSERIAKFGILVFELE